MKTLEKRIKSKAAEIGIVHLGMTSVDKPKHFENYVQWAEKGYAGEMWYLTENTRKEKRGKINEVFPAAKSIMLAAFSYKPQDDRHTTDAKFARYGW